MAFKISKKGAKNNIFFEKVKDVLLSSQGFPIFLTCTIFGILFVLFRMKSVELDYKISSVKKDIKKIKLENKELKADKAKRLSMKNLRRLASKYELNEPQQKQIIVIP